MGLLHPLRLMALLLWAVGLVSANRKLVTILKTSPAYSGLTDYQRFCGVDNNWSVAYTSECENMQCLCTSPQTMSMAADECMLTMEGWNGKYVGLYSADVYNGIMTFFANECGTFEVQLKASASQIITYKSTPTQTNFGSGPKETGGATAGSPADNSKNNNINVNVTGGGTSNVNISDKVSEAPPSKALKWDAIIGIVAGVATVIGVIVTV
ncbi:hypothetical protein QBC39DRAFT_351596 [Podospora conica]|nr:hypothetical protein QBC39DRAFT_351596 [Schizothecium conicum]